MQFSSPWAFLLLLVIPPLAWWAFRRNRQGAVQMSSVQQAAMAGKSIRQRLVALPPALRILALVLLVTALARPQEGLERVHDVSQGIAIEMVVDRSSSMTEEMRFEGERLNRLDVVKRVFHEFVAGNDDELEGRPNDLVGMIAFARFAETVCPLTLAHDAMPRFLDTVHIVQRRDEDGTAIGDAIALAAARLKTAEEVLQKQAEVRDDTYHIQSKIIILLTDGANTAGKRPPLQAAQLAAEWGIKIYTIGVGGKSGFQPMQLLMSLPSRSGVDERLLSGIADATGGKFHLATSADSLRTIYKEIDRLEKTEIESIRYVDFRERFAPFALAALALIGTESVLRATWLRRIP